MKIDINDMLNKSGIKLRRPFRPDPRDQEAHERMMKATMAKPMKPMPHKTGDGRNINAT